MSTTPSTFADEKALSVCVIGLGYVGLPLAVAFGKKRNLLGFDNSSQRISELREYKDITLEMNEDELRDAIGLTLTDRIEDIANSNCYIVAVPSPIDEHKQPNILPLETACRTIGAVLKNGDIVIFESTVYPGFTREICVSLLEKTSGLKFNESFFCGYSPERVNPGDKVNTLSTVVKVTSGSTPEVAEIIDQLYGTIVTAGTYMAPSMEVAEAAKVIENAQRDLNIAFVNELSMIFDKLEIDTTEVLSAASTKWNFLPFKPGMVGGHCIGVDPYYLTYRAHEVGHNPEIILAGRRLNDRMAKYVAKKIFTQVQEVDRPDGLIKIAVLGVTFKENCPDTRNSKVYDLIDELVEFGVEVIWHDPYCSESLVGINTKAKYMPLDYIENQVDAIAVSVPHNVYRATNPEIYKKMYRGDGNLFADVKAAFDKDVMGEFGFRVWRL